MSHPPRRPQPAPGLSPGSICIPAHPTQINTLRFAPIYSFALLRSLLASLPSNEKQSSMPSWTVILAALLMLMAVPPFSAAAAVHFEDTDVAMRMRFIR
ncbi:hypothetical protein DFH08DRAFT_958491 [Mycena albidolilacea]|uniref:Uncharacterized protein n=1 Tax=Mycena albidolilacea TaxID=1033008 RepID=A0AAD7EVR9_9AGAR|nr:hypothetical protein DFH08DRAFT_958491 [Mycena albidolilacea]